MERERSAVGPVLSIVLVFSILMTWLVGKSHALFQPYTEVQDFGRAEWLEYPGGSEVVYLRREVVLPEQPRKAWMLVGGVDRFEVRVNGAKIAGEEYLGARPSSAVDLSSALKRGRNVIGIRVASSTRDTPAQGIAVVEWRTARGRGGAVTDRSWRAESRKVTSRFGEASWTSAEFSAASWPAASVSPVNASPPPVIPPSLPLKAVAQVPAGHWLGTPDPAAGTASFERTFDVQGEYIRDAWLGVSARGLALVAVNDVVIGPIVGTEARMRAFDIASYLERGENRIAVHVNATKLPAKVAVAGGVDGPETSLDLSSDGSWRELPDGRPPVLRGAPGEDPPVVTGAQGIAIRNATRLAARRTARIFGTVFGWCVLLGWVFSKAMNGRALSVGASWLIYCQPLAVCTLVLLFARFVDWDPRLSWDAVRPVGLPAALVALIGLWLLAVFLYPIVRQRIQPASLEEPSL